MIIVLAIMMAFFMMPYIFTYAAEEDNWAGLQEKINAGGTINADLSDQNMHTAKLYRVS